MEAADFATSYWEQGQPNNFPTSNHQVNFAIFQGYGICCITDHFGHLVEDLPGNKSWKHLRKRGRPNQSLLVLVPSFVLGRCFQRLQPRFLPNLCCSPFENTAIQFSNMKCVPPLTFSNLVKSSLSLSLYRALRRAVSQRRPTTDPVMWSRGSSGASKWLPSDHMKSSWQLPSSDRQNPAPVGMIYSKFKKDVIHGIISVISPRSPGLYPSTVG